MSRVDEKVRIFMDLAVGISGLSTCSRLKVGTLILDRRMERVHGIGYNGNASGEPNRCDSTVPGNCGCVHSEMNALIKCGVQDRDKVMIVTTSPCLMCAKLIVNSGFISVHFKDPYRQDDGAIEMMTRRGITVTRCES